MATTVELIISGLLVFVFGMAGTMKLFPLVPAVHKDLVADFIKYAKICPTVYLGFTPDPQTYRQCVAVVEVLCVIAILVGSPSIRHWCYGILMIVMVGACYTHAVVGEFDRIAVPATLFVACLYLFTRPMVQGLQKTKRH